MTSAKDGGGTEKVKPMGFDELVGEPQRRRLSLFTALAWGLLAKTMQGDKTWIQVDGKLRLGHGHDLNH